ncbi:-aminocyclopropane-11-aminocyclopropane-1-carboxylate-carboxylate synthase 1 [Octopus vulgaris]|uniref:-aminocyclopropane-11-aminocyclopropane-1-carboxylate-carboxylate synthase 1 n=1 Tax=Octopus vulgaris TaxID=6645 RepID=A0AA36AXI1_OCTVU|nr:-aminocyclopropane-11-aminocyclopropane-1-carboxylate-carboxylate synthase 1 [Octopus vulgaris]
MEDKDFCESGVIEAVTVIIMSSIEPILNSAKNTAAMYFNNQYRNETTVSKRAIGVIKYPDLLVDYACKARENVYDAVLNKNGIIDLGLAENTLCEDMILKKLNDIHSKIKIQHEDLYYFKNHGSDKFREAVSKFMTTFLHPINPIDKNNLIILSGVTSLLNIVAFGLAEENDYFLCLTPYYSRIRNDILDFARIQTYDVSIKETGPNGEIEYIVTYKKLEAAYLKAKEKGYSIKGIVVINPNNPTGRLLPKNEIEIIFQFAKSFDLHAIFDEIYGLSIFGTDAEPMSVLSMNIPQPTKTHVLWGFSKDLALSGFRCGVLYSQNDKLLSFMRKVSFYSGISMVVQNLLTRFIEDIDWFKNIYFPTLRERMSETYEMAVSQLESKGVTVYRSSGGFFIWANFCKFMKEDTFECEMELFKTFFEHKVFFCGGRISYSKEPGWFRIIFTRKMPILKVALERIEKVLELYG